MESKRQERELRERVAQAIDDAAAGGLDGYRNDRDDGLLGLADAALNAVASWFRDNGYLHVYELAVDLAHEILSDDPAPATRGLQGDETRAGSGPTKSTVVPLRRSDWSFD